MATSLVTGNGVRDSALHKSVYETLVHTIVDVVGEKFYTPSDIHLDATFANDIELESMEMMEVAERMIETYREVDFMAWFSQMEFKDLVELTVGDIVDFITSTLERAGSTSGTAAVTGG